MVSMKESLLMHLVLFIFIYFMLFMGFDVYFIALTLLVGPQEGHLACKNWVMRYWHGCLMPAYLVCHRKRPLNGCTLFRWTSVSAVAMMSHNCMNLVFGSKLGMKHFSVTADLTVKCFCCWRAFTLLHVVGWQTPVPLIPRGLFCNMWKKKTGGNGLKWLTK